jgi:hypothetical protein
MVMKCLPSMKSGWSMSISVEGNHLRSISLTPPISFVHLTSAVCQISKVLVAITDISPTFSAFGQDGTQFKKN